MCNGISIGRPSRPVRSRLLVALAWMFQNTEMVTDAYASERRFDALDLRPLTFSAATIPSESEGSLALIPPPDTSEAAIAALAFVDAVAADPSIEGGTSEVHGSVAGLGPDDAALVRLTRVTDGGENDLVVPVAEDGEWSAPGINGGRYRIRAFVPGLRATNQSAVVFVLEDQVRELELSVTTPPEDLLVEVVSDELFIGERAVVALTFGRQSVDDQGRTLIVPVGGVATRVSFSAGRVPPLERCCRLRRRWCSALPPRM